MAEYIELTEELILSMRAGAKAICNTKKYHGTIYMLGAFSDNPKEMPYLQAAEILYAASEKEPADVAPVVHAEWLDIVFDPMRRSMTATCSHCMVRGEVRVKSNECGFAVPDSDFCPSCGAKMDL